MGDELRQRKNLPQKIYDGGNNDDEVYSSDQIDDSKLERKEKVFYYAGNKDIRFKTLSILTIIALFIRLFQISHPEQVVFDEVHFGGFASKYIKGQFFMDVHPPLGKLLIAASGLAAGFNGSFDFKEIGMDYIEPRVPYVAMRLLPGILGVGLVPISYITMRNMGASEANSILAAIMVLFENGLACQSRLILLDSILVFFVALSAMMWTDFLANQDEPFTLNWWYPLGMSGISIGLAVSVKWVGLFVIATVGVSTLKNLWDLIDEKITFNTFSKHFLARALCLIVLPATVYMAIFKIHFLVLANGGSGNGFMSPEFQATLGGIAKINAFEDVGYYSEIYLRHDGTTGGYLHSHKDTYPSGSKQQQITTYPFTDENSIFTVLPKLLEYNGTFVPETVEGFVKLKHKDIVRLQHKPTKKFLHSHDVRPSVTDNKDHNEVSGYGAEGFSGDTNDHWRIELENEHDTLKALTKFRLVHVNTGCFLFSHKVKLPKWGYEQQEVTCTRVGRRYLTLWRIEGNENPRMPADSKKVTYPHMGFFGKFFESHATMWTINNGLTSSHPFDSRPGSWPFLRRGISFWTSKNSSSPSLIYLIGNPFVWWLSTISLGVYIFYNAVVSVLLKRQLIKDEPVQYKNGVSWAGLMFLGWLLHYFPFFLMERQLFLHHYFPALYFSILCFAMLLDVFLKISPKKLKWVSALLIGFVSFYIFLQYLPISYGYGMKKSKCTRLKLREHWDWDCNMFTDN